jgi:hypothetical protein
MTFLEEQGERINDLFAEIKKIDPKEPATGERAWNELRVLHREYSNEIEQSGVGRPQMRQRVNTLLDKHGQRWELSSIEQSEVIGLLRVFAVDAIKDGRDKPEDMKAFMNEWDVHGRGITVQGIAMTGWMLARDEVVGDTS